MGRDYAVFLLGDLEVWNNVVCSFSQSTNNARGGAVGSNIALHAESSRVRFPRKVTARMLRPQFYLWPPQSQRAVLWVLTPFVMFQLNRQGGPTLHDLMDFLRRTKWKMCQSPSRRRSVANFLTVLDTSKFYPGRN